MATYLLPILGGAIPDLSGDVFPEPLSIKASNDQYGIFVWVFNDTSVRDGLSGSFTVPNNYDSAANLVVYWLTTAITGDVEIDFDYTSIAVGENFDPSANQEAVNNNDTANGTTLFLNSVTISLTDGNFVAGDIVQFELFRDGTDGGDTIAAAIMITAAYFQYDDAA